MIPLDVLLIFVLASSAMVLSPGPDNIILLTQSAMHGRRTGFLITLGLCTGLLVHTAAVALGVAALLKTSPWTFTALKICGALYLLYLAWGAFRAGASRINTDSEAPAAAAKLYARGLVTNATNPKVAIFFLAFLPQFADPARGSVALQISLLGLIYMLLSLLMFCVVTLTAARLGDWLKRSERAQVWINRVAGTVFVLLATRLLFSRA